MAEIKKENVGLLHKNLGIPMGKNISLGALMTAKKSMNPKVRRRATFAMNMNHSHA